ncbi:MAG TPA: S49 family peptidase, partial [Nitrospirae bacterium]|nr:S49 family peptidase [Nitrospirota bacterium]
MKILDVLTAPWAIHPDRMKEIIEIYSTQVRAGKMDINTIESKISLFGKKEDEQAYDVINGVAVLDIQGVLSKRASWFMMFFGYAGMQAIGENLKKALADPSVKAVLLNIDSPGGTVDGTAELAQLIYESRGEKPIVAFTDGMIASAAYWIASAADTRYISSDTTEVGSIGVIMTHVDYSQAYEKVGIKITQIVSGKYKNIGSPYKPLGD